MYTKPLTPWWEIEGMVESPEGEEEWFGLYQARDRDEAKVFLHLVLIQEDEPQHARYEDFRIAPPSDPRTADQALQDRKAYTLMGVPQRRRRRVA